MTTIFVKDDLRAQVEAATGGAVTVLYTDAGHPSYMNVIPRFNLQDIDASLGTGTHPAFIVNGVEKSEIFIGQYQGIVKDNNLLSIPGVIPTVSTNFDTFRQRAAANGVGWHIMTNAEWMAVALWCWKNGFQPRGNNNWGRDTSLRYETGRRGDQRAPGETTGDGKTFTGSGPASWRHNGQATGIADLNGNVWEWQAGYRLMDGEIQVIPDNDAADNTKDLSRTSVLWKAIRASDGALVAPGTAGTLKYDSVTAGTNTGSVRIGDIRLSDVMTNRNGTAGDDSHLAYTNGAFEALPVKDGLNVPAIAKVLGIAPVGAGLEGDNIWVRNYGERLCLAGGNFYNGAGAGLFARNLNNARTNVNNSVGARPDCGFFPQISLRE